MISALNEDDVVVMPSVVVVVVVCVVVNVSSAVAQRWHDEATRRAKMKFFIQMNDCLVLKMKSEINPLAD